MAENRHQEYVLTILGPDPFALTNWLAEQGWVFSHVAKTGLFSGTATGYSTGADAREWEGIGVSDGTIIKRVDILHE